MLAGSGGLVILAALDLAGVPIVGALPLPCLILAMGVLLATSWRFTGQFARDEPLDLKLLDAGLIALAAMAALGLALGTFGVLRFSTLMLGAGLIGVAGMLFALRPRADEPAGATEPDANGLPDLRPGWTTLLLAGLTAFALVQAVLGRRLRPPIGDPLAYHLSFPAEWLQHADLGMPVPAAGDPSTPFYPLNSSLWMFWTLAPFEGEILARFVQLPFLFLLGLAVYRLAREVGLGVHVALAAVALSVTLPNIARSASLPENDLILATLLVAATANLARLWNAPGPWRAVLTALPLGLAAGTKVVALPYADLLAITLAAAVLWKWRRGEFAKPAGVLLGSAGLVVLLGGYSYLRNAVVMDNPLYPSGYELFGREIFSGIYVMSREWRRAHAFYPFDWTGFFLESRRTFGFIVTFWVLPGLIAAAVALIAEAFRPAGSRRSNGYRALGSSLPALLLCGWTVLSLGIFWFIIPYHFGRFLYPTVVWGIVAGAWGFSALLDRLPLSRGHTLVPLIAVPFVVLNVVNVPLNLAIRSTALYWVEALVVVGGTVLAFVVAYAVPAATLRRGLLAVVIGAIAVASIGWPFYESRYEEGRFTEWRVQIQGYSPITDAWEWLYRQTEAEPATIAVAGTNEVYPLYGEGLDNRIVTIRPSGALVRYDWGEPSQIFGAPDPAAWLAALDQAGVEYVYMTEDVSLGGWPLQRAWAEAAPERFKVVFQNDAAIIWEVVLE